MSHNYCGRCGFENPPVSTVFDKNPVTVIISVTFVVVIWLGLLASYPIPGFAVGGLAVIVWVVNKVFSEHRRQKSIIDRFNWESRNARR